ncbi:hypothetical protein [Methylomonas sp. 11b]|uniref:hypothetical protein n=1 Tax=Methylomonas sp. 11b TaxID=1168169 RepID=UPI001E30C458|nr:hypothetical protein [Methylomonas sp. 11b]
MGDADPLHTFGYVAEQLGNRGIAFIFTREALGENRIGPDLKKRFFYPARGLGILHDPSPRNNRDYGLSAKNRENQFPHSFMSRLFSHVTGLMSNSSGSKPIFFNDD